MAVNDFSGEYRFTLDSKKRVNIPAAMRKMLSPEADETLVFTRGFEGCVYVYPHDEWKRLTHRLNALDSFNVKVRDFIRLFIGPAVKTVMDSQGRVLLPDNILKMANIISVEKKKFGKKKSFGSIVREVYIFNENVVSWRLPLRD